MGLCTLQFDEQFIANVHKILQQTDTLKLPATFKQQFPTFQGKLNIKGKRVAQDFETFILAFWDARAKLESEEAAQEIERRRLKKQKTAKVSGK